jgi:hypothetical protein
MNGKIQSMTLPAKLPPSQQTKPMPGQILIRNEDKTISDLNVDGVLV